MKLIICEKKSQVESFIKAGIGMEMKQGYATMQKDGEEWRAVWSKGHLLTLLAPDEMIEDLSWQDTDKLVPIPRNFDKKVNPDEGMPDGAKSQAYLDRIGFHMKKANEIIIGTDSDREGEYVGYSIIEHLGWDGPVRRLWLSAGLDPKSIKQAFSSIQPAEKTKAAARAAEARNVSDRAYMFAVRGFTYYAKYGKFGKALAEGRGRAGTMSVGRVQTPTLSMVVRREEEIENFVSVPHFEISGVFSDAEGSTDKVEASFITRQTKELIEQGVEGVTWLPSSQPPNEQGEVPLDKPLFTDKSKVDDFVSRLTASQNDVTVLEYKESTSEKQPSKTYSLPDAQADIGRALKIKGGLVQTILEDLYEQGYTSYARTSKADLPVNFYDPSNRNDLFNAVIGIEEMAEGTRLAQEIHDGSSSQYQSFMPKVFTKKDLEHHGIVPTPMEMSDNKLRLMQPKKKNDKSKKIEHSSEMMRQAYLMVCKRFVSAMLPPAKHATQSVKFKVPTQDLLGYDESLFKANAKRLVDPGFTAFFNNSAGNDSSLPKMQNGDSAYLESVGTKEAKTRPPTRYTSASLMAAMESVAREIRDPKLRKLLKVAEGLGTPATRSKVIETLEARDFMIVEKGAYRPTPRGRALVKSVPDWMASPETSAVWEDYLSQICQVQDDTEAMAMRDKFIEEQTSLIEGIITELKQKYDHDLGERVGGGGVSPKMKKAITTIAERKKLTIDPEMLKNFDQCKKFLDEHLGENAAPMPPSEKQIGLYEKIAAIVGKPDNAEELLKDSKKVSEFIDKNIDEYRNNAKPSEAQVKYAKSIAEGLPDDQKPDEKVFESAKLCSEFLDKHAKGTGKKKAGAKGRSGPPKRRRKKA